MQDETNGKMSDGLFQLKTSMVPQGDQPQAIASIVKAFDAGAKHHTLLGVTGSGKTFTMAHAIAKLGRPALIMAPNKTLAAQLFTEFKELFPHNSVEYFISYYDYFQPEAYVPSTDTYIAKDALINDDIDKMRHTATQALFERRDVIIIASVSCIYGLGSPDAYAKNMIALEKGTETSREKVMAALIDIQYTRHDAMLSRGNFRVRGDTIDVMPAQHKDEALRIQFFDEKIERIAVIDSLTGRTLQEIDKVSLYPNSHYVPDRSDIATIVKEILTDLGIRLRELKALGKMVEYQRLEQRTMHDIELFEHLGFCPGIENYSRYLTGVPPGHPPPCLLDYFPKNFLTIIDESHVTLPQVQGMFRGDRARKQVLVDFGFRLPSALDNRPLNFDEFLARTHQILHVSATPGPLELGLSGGAQSEQIIRPTGLIDPEIEVRPATNQIDDLQGEIRKTVDLGHRVLVTTLTKRMAEELSQFYREQGFRIRYLHSDIDSLERFELLRDLRQGVYDILVGINLLREGLDLPEVALVAVLDADREGFLRSRSALIQVVGRAARNLEGRVIFYADSITKSMRACLDETSRRRTIQTAYNVAHGIVPKSIIKALPMDLRRLYGLEPADNLGVLDSSPEALSRFAGMSIPELEKNIKKKTKDMHKAAGDLEFEKAASIRDDLKALKEAFLARSSKGESEDPATP